MTEYGSNGSRGNLNQVEKSSIRIGTSGYSYPDWVGGFYPQDLPKSEWLPFYAQHFGFCELNFSYYRMPTPEQLEKFLDVPLEYALKAHGSLTHERIEQPAAREDFLEAAKVLDSDNKLASVLLQFPYSFGYTPENRKYLLELLTFLNELPLVVEFRHPAWIRDSVLDQLKQGGWGISMLDSPQVKGGMPDYEAVTASHAYLRFHGRNQDMWWKGNNVSRYDYEYSEKELEDWLPCIKAMASMSKTTYIAFNNHARGQAIKNANQLKSLLETNP